jgi:hypothetical protein
LPRGKVAVATMACAVLLLAAVGIAALVPHGSAPTSDPAASAIPAISTTTQAGNPPSSPPREPIQPADVADVADDAAVARLRGVEPVVPSPATAKITGGAAQQPDLYAAEFVRRLLTQDYRQPRIEHLRWVQAESATTTEPLVIGKVPPELRGRLAVFSATDIGSGPAPIPAAQEWEGFGLQQAFTTVVIDRVEEPFAWTNAVASGRITDPGITGREVAATVTRHTRVNDHDATTTFSVSVLLNLEGPPVRRYWGVVAVISYTAIQTG